MFRTQTHTRKTGKIGVFNTTFLLSNCLLRHLGLNYSHRKLSDSCRGAGLYELMNHTVTLNIISSKKKQPRHNIIKQFIIARLIRRACKIATVIPKIQISTSLSNLLDVNFVSSVSNTSFEWVLVTAEHVFESFIVQ